MLTVLWIFLGLVGVVLVAAIVIAATPVYFRLRADAGAEGRFRLDVWLLGGLTPRIAVVDTARKTESAAKPAPPKKPKQKNKKGRESRWKMPDGSWKRMLKAGPEFIRDELRRIHIDRLVIDADFGLGDPADTGRVYGLVCPIIYTARSDRLRLDLRPDFTRARFDGDAEVALHFTPGSLVIPVIRFGWQIFVRRS